MACLKVKYIKITNKKKFYSVGQDFGVKNVFVVFKIVLSVLKFNLVKKGRKKINLPGYCVLLFEQSLKSQTLIGFFFFNFSFLIVLIDI